MFLKNPKVFDYNTSLKKNADHELILHKHEKYFFFLLATIKNNKFFVMWNWYQLYDIFWD